jgi:hypothetical protein
MCAGVDWAKGDHAVCVVGDKGEALDQFTVAHDAAGLKALVRRLLTAGVAEVGIEHPDGPVLEALPQVELTVLVIPAGQLKNLRSRYGFAGNKDDRFDRSAPGVLGAVRPWRQGVRRAHNKGTGAAGHGNRYVAAVLDQAAAAAGKTDTFLGERYRRITKYRGKKRAIVAVGRSMLIMIWHLLADPKPASTMHPDVRGRSDLDSFTRC